MALLTARAARLDLPAVVPETMRDTAFVGMSDMWIRLRRALAGLLSRLQRGRNEQRTVDARARFWADVREGEREADARSQP